jgi:hypothetical protein
MQKSITTIAVTGDSDNFDERKLIQSCKSDHLEAHDDNLVQQLRCHSYFHQQYEYMGHGRYRTGKQ